MDAGLDLEGLGEATRAHVPDTEQECIERLYELRWGRDGWRCRRCRGHVWYPVTDRPRVRVCYFCAAHTSVTAGTLLHGTRVPLRCWFLAASLLMRPQGCSSVEFARRAGVHKQTAWRILHRLRAATVPAGGFLLKGKVGYWTSGIRCRPPRRPNRSGHAVMVLADDSGGVKYLVCTHRAQRAVPRHAPHVPPDQVRRSMDYDDPARLAGWQVRTQLKHTHLWVSERWLARYLSSRCFQVNHADQGAVRGLIALAMRHPAGAFGTLAPPIPRLGMIHGSPGRRCPCASCSSEAEAAKQPWPGGSPGHLRWVR